MLVEQVPNGKIYAGQDYSGSLYASHALVFSCILHWGHLPKK